MIAKQVIIASPDSDQRARLSEIVQKFPDFKIVAKTRELMDTYVEIENRRPNAVLIAEPLAVLPEFEVMRGLFASLDVRWLVVANGKLRVGDHAKTTTDISKGSDLFSVSCTAPPETLVTQLRGLTRSAISRAEPRFKSEIANIPARGQPSGLILIGASTGGVDALLTVLKGFPPNCPPTLIVQHTGTGFGESLAALLNRQTAPDVSVAQDGLVLKPGMVALGAGTKTHITFANESTYKLANQSGMPVCGHMPSIDVMFRSALPFAKNTCAALLTGMGRDGAEGLKALRTNGARTVAQDEASCVVYGMPKAAVELGATDHVLPLSKIAQSLLTKKSAQTIA